jgi:hypothetical protein
METGCTETNATPGDAQRKKAAALPPGVPRGVAPGTGRLYSGTCRGYCYQLHIGLDAMAYSAFAGHWDDVTRSAAQALTLT